MAEGPRRIDTVAESVTRGRLFGIHAGVDAVGQRLTTPLEHAAAALLACGPTAPAGGADRVGPMGSFRAMGPHKTTPASHRAAPGVAPGASELTTEIVELHAHRITSSRRNAARAIALTAVHPQPMPEQRNGPPARWRTAPGNCAL